MAPTVTGKLRVWRMGWRSVSTEQTPAFSRLLSPQPDTQTQHTGGEDGAVGSCHSPRDLRVDVQLRKKRHLTRGAESRLSPGCPILVTGATREQIGKWKEGKAINNASISNRNSRRKGANGTHFRLKTDRKTK